MWHQGDLQCQSVLHMRSATEWERLWPGNHMTDRLNYPINVHVLIQHNQEIWPYLPDPLSRGSTWGSVHETSMGNLSLYNPNLQLSIYHGVFVIPWSSSRMLVMSAQVIQLVNTRAHTQRRLRSVCVPFSLQLFWHEAAYKRYQRHQNTMYFLAAWQNSPWTTLWLQISSSGKWSGVLKGVHCCKLCLCVRQ